MALESFKLIVITSEINIPKEPEVINQLFEEGLQLLHIRKPDSTMEGVRELILSIPQSFHNRIVLHSHYSLLNSFNLKGAHLPEKVRKGNNHKQIKNIISTSFHSLKDITNENTNFEYAFFSPVFQSISKQAYEPTEKTETIKDFLKNNNSFPIIALGGITDKNILLTKDMGFSGAACLGYIWENSNPIAQFQKLQISSRLNYL